MKRIENAPIVSDDDEMQYISTQPILDRSMSPMLPSNDDKSDSVCPFILFNETVLSQRNKEQKEKNKDNAKQLLTWFFQDHKS